MSSGEWPGAKYESPETQSYVGLSTAEARAAAARAGVSMVRVIDGPNDVMTFDFRSYRLNLYVVDGVVTRAAFF